MSLSPAVPPHLGHPRLPLCRAGSQAPQPGLPRHGHVAAPSPASPTAAPSVAQRVPARHSAYLPGSERLQLAQTLQHSLHVILQCPDGAGHMGLQLRRQLQGQLGDTPGILLPPSEARICGVQRWATLRWGGRQRVWQRCPCSSGSPRTPSTGTAPYAVTKPLCIVTKQPALGLIGGCPHAASSRQSQELPAHPSTLTPTSHHWACLQGHRPPRHPSTVVVAAGDL